MITDWDAAYDNSGREADAPAIFADWAARGARYRATAQATLDVAYGAHPRERLDLFHPDGPPKGLMVFLHGGYWRAMDKDASSWVAAGAVTRGWAVAVPSYPLAPEVGIATITRSAANAVAKAAGMVDGPLVLSGHSAGGHLAARMVCDDAALPPAVAARVRRVVGVSGVYDLRPLLNTALNSTLGLDAAQALAESPAVLAPVAGARLLAVVGGDETPEFRRQTALIANIWTGLGADCAAWELARHRHFSVMDAFADPHGDVVSMALA